MTTRTKRCIGILYADREAHGALIGAVSEFFRPDVDLDLDLVRLRAAKTAGDRQQIAQLRRSLLPASVDVFDLLQGSDWMFADQFLASPAERFGNASPRPRVIAPPATMHWLDEVLERRQETRGVFLTGIGPWKDFFGSDACMQLTKRWIDLDDPTFRLEPLSTFANFATVGSIDRAWLEWTLFDLAHNADASPKNSIARSINLAEGLPISRDRVGAYLETLKRMLRTERDAV